MRVNYLALEPSTPLSIHVLMSLLFSSCHHNFYMGSEMDIYLSVILYIMIIWGKSILCRYSWIWEITGSLRNVILVQMRENVVKLWCQDFFLLQIYFSFPSFLCMDVNISLNTNKFTYCSNQNKKSYDFNQFFAYTLKWMNFYILVVSININTLLFFPPLFFKDFNFERECTLRKREKQIPC